MPMLEQAEKTAVLTAREQEIALLACRGLTNKAIALELKASTGTVKVHMHNIFQKLQIKTRSALTAVGPWASLLDQQKDPHEVPQP
jgi:DNA-binding NarL/FixJ family response regulator